MSMTRWIASGAGGLALTAVALAQQPITLPTQAPTMPGQVVGSSLPRASVMPVSGRLPNAVPGVGSPIGRGPGGIPPQLDPMMATPPGKPISLQNVIAPYPMEPKPEPSFWDILYTRWAMLFGSSEPAQRPTNFTPGISRRNRERNNLFRRD